MPPIKDDGPNHIKPFTFHGIDFTGRGGDTQLTATCPFCEREGKFYVNETNGLWSCQVCTEKGNIKTFLKRVYEESRKLKCDYKEIVKERKLLHSETLQEWGLCRSFITNEWMLPAYSVDTVARRPKLESPAQLYLWKPDLVTKKNRFIAPGFTNTDDGVKTTHALFCGKWDDKKPNVAILEGLWDAVAFNEVVSKTRRDEEGLCEYVEEEPYSLGADTNVVATPGANVFQEQWIPIFAGKNVTIYYDNDYSKENKRTKAIVQGAGILGVKRVTEMLSANGHSPSSIAYLKWGEEGYTHQYPTRYDVRDHLSQGSTIENRVGYLGELIDKVSPVSDEWYSEGKHISSKDVPNVLPCNNWEELRRHWVRAMFWNDGLDHALPVMLACAASVHLPRDLVWLKVVSPPSTGKTQLAEALAIATDAVVIVSTFTGLHSGLRLENGADGSLISLLGGMCFIIKEGDTLLRLPDRERVWAELRDAYDKNTRTHFKNGVANQYLNHAFTHILCGTQSLHEMDDSELGQRYLDIVIMDRIDSDMETRINEHQLTGLFDELQQEPTTEKNEPTISDKMKASQLTAGYLQYLRANFAELIRKIHIPPTIKTRLNDYAQFVAYFRARPSSTQSEEATRELSTRLATQIGKLAVGLAVVLNKDSVDDEVMQRIRKVALDTGRGKTANIAKILYASGDEGITVEIISSSLLQPRMETLSMLQFLSKIEVTELYRKEGKISFGTSMRWRLTQTVRNLYKRVVEE